MIDLEIQARIDQLYADMKPLMDYFGTKPMTIDERYARIQERKQAEAALQAVKLRPKPRWKL